MELLLNILWLLLGATAVFALVCSRGRPNESDRLPYLRALLAVLCIVVLLFPVVSASDDLHPAQAIVEDASKRVQQGLAPLPNTHSSIGIAMLLGLLSILVLSGPTPSQPLQFAIPSPKPLDGELIAVSGRAPPVRF